jgi:3-dehydroquinate dehydratase-2
MRFLILHGPNLNLLGEREPEVYGIITLDQINESLAKLARELGHELRVTQSNIEGELVDAVQGAAVDCQGILINPAGYTHTSVALRDAIAAVSIPTVEVHLSLPAAREDFRQILILTGVVAGRIEGFGPASYLLGFRARK